MKNSYFFRFKHEIRLYKDALTMMSKQDLNKFIVLSLEFRVHSKLRILNLLFHKLNPIYNLITLLNRQKIKSWVQFGNIK